MVAPKVLPAVDTCHHPPQYCVADMLEMCYNAHMDTTIRNLDPKAYRALKARAALLGKTVGEAVNEAIRAYLNRPGNLPKRGSLRDLRPVDFGPGSEHLSEQVDEIVYGVSK